MRPIDGDALEEIVRDGLKEVPHNDGLARRHHKAEHIHFLDLIRRAPTIAPPPNDPLTLEELREMDEEPVWCERQKNYVFIAYVKDEPYKQIWFFTNKGKWDTILFHHTRFYRRKPEEGA